MKTFYFLFLLFSPILAFSSLDGSGVVFAETSTTYGLKAKPTVEATSTTASLYKKIDFSFYGSVSLDLGPNAGVSKGVITINTADMPYYIYAYFNSRDLLRIDEKLRADIVANLKKAQAWHAIMKAGQSDMSRVLFEYDINDKHKNKVTFVYNCKEEGTQYNILVIITHKGETAGYDNDGLFYFCNDENVGDMIRILEEAGIMLGRDGKGRTSRKPER